MKFHVGQKVQYIGETTRLFGSFEIIMKIGNLPPNILIIINKTSEKYWSYECSLQSCVIIDLIGLLE